DPKGFITVHSQIVVAPTGRGRPGSARFVSVVRQLVIEWHSSLAHSLRLPPKTKSFLFPRHLGTVLSRSHRRASTRGQSSHSSRSAGSSSRAGEGVVAARRHPDLPSPAAG